MQNKKVTEINDVQDTYEKVIQVDRINKVVKGGKRLAFRAFVITGNLEGSVGMALGKSKEVPSAIKKGIEKANKKRFRINIVNGTIPHEILGTFGSARVILKPARPGTGVIAGGAVRILLEAAGIRDIVAKSLGSGNAFNAAKAAMNGLLRLKDYDTEVRKRGKDLPVNFARQTNEDAEEASTPKSSKTEEKASVEDKQTKKGAKGTKSTKSEAPKKAKKEDTETDDVKSTE